jgi:phenylacetate-coenzyme A ligase PaaK-like adenylate-forming protein
VLLGRPIRPRDVDRITRELLAGLAEFGEPATDGAVLPGRWADRHPAVRRARTTRSLRATARAAVRHTAYYGQVFDQLGLNPATLDLDGWAQVPVTPGRALRSLPAAFVSTAARPALLAQTTATAGVWFSRAELELITALGALSAAVGLGLRPTHTVAHAGCSRATLDLLHAEESATRIGAGFVQLGTVDPESALDRLAAPLGLPGRASQITHLTTSASYLAALVAQAERGGWRPEDFGLQRISVVGEVLSAPLRERAAATLGAPVAASHLMTELLPAGAAPCSQGHLHHGSEFGHLEVLDPQSWEPTAPGGVGMLVHTPYVPYRDCTLLLRHATGDLVRLPAGPTDCEAAGLPTTSDVIGRWTGPLSAALPTRDLLDLLEAEPEVPLPTRYALTDRPGGAVLHVLVRRLPASGLLGRLEDRATAAGLPLAAIRLHDDRDAMPPTVPLSADLREDTAADLGRSPARAAAPQLGGRR